MTRNDLSIAVHTDLFCGHRLPTVKDVDNIIANVFWQIGHALTKGEKISIKGFGSFSVDERPARNVVIFHPAKALKDGVNS